MNPNGRAASKLHLFDSRCFHFELIGKLCVAFASALLALTARGQTFAPYAVDSSTLHLWHLNEAGAPAADAVTGTDNLSMQGLLGGAALTGTSSLPGLGGSVLANSGTGTDGLLLAATALANGSGDDVTFSHANPTTGAFTFEAVIKFNSSYNPATDQSGRTMQILSMENDDPLARVFQFRYVGRIVTGPFYNQTITPPQIQFINLAGSVQSLTASVPTSGAMAVTGSNWFHVAVTYDGNAGSSNNLKIYWTRLTSALGSSGTANLLGTSTMTLDLPNATGDFALGNEARTTGGETDGFAGWIDEVRISGTARAANAMMPSNYDSDTDGLPDSWEMTYFGNLNQTASGDPDADGITNIQEFRNGTNPAVNSDVDGDGLPDAWEQTYFGSLIYNGSSDPDGDTYNNAAEYAAGSNPNNTISTPADTDADGLPDAWEQTYFGSLSYDSTDDPDSDGYTNAQEYSAGTYPNNGASVPGDSDADGLVDAWEMAKFGTMTYSANDDPDGDWFTNAQEQAAGTNPADASSYPAGPKSRLIPVDDGNSSTSEYGYALTDINTVAYICNGLRTVGDQQFLTYYGRHQTNSTYTYNNTLWVARRTVGSKLWEVFRTTFTANTITDDHDTIAFGIDGEGYMHLSWGMHNASAYHYAKSTLPVTGTNSIAFGADLGTMTGNEVSVTYPQFLTLPNGDLLYLYRVGGTGGGSGNGNTYWNRYSLSTHTWSNVNLNGSTLVPFVDGITYSYNAYPNMPCMDSSGNLFLTWTWRYSADWQTNENFAFAKSNDFGVSWKRSNESTYTLPLAEKTTDNTKAENILTIPQGSSLINQAGMCLDDQGRPVIATWWAPLTSSSDYRRQYMVVFPTVSGTTWSIPWSTRQVSNRPTTLDAASFKDTSAAWVRDLGRPVALCDKQGRVIVLYRDNHGSGGLTVAYSQTRATDPNRLVWTTLDLTNTNLGACEPVIDLARWQQDNVLQVIHQSSQYTAHNGLTYTPPANTASKIGVFEWDEAAYFAPPKLNVSCTAQDAQFSWNSIPGYSYRLWTTTDLSAWTALTTVSGDGTTQAFTQQGGAGDKKRFWRLEVKEGSF